MSEQNYTIKSELGRELQDILAIAKACGMSKEKTHAAILGRCGVCSASWGSPYVQSQSAKSPEAQTLERS